MDILKIVTAGSVDDGKSTLIGQLLYVTNSLKEDQLENIKAKSNAKGYDYIDLSLATDGLLTEREQGITIDVSNIYFSSENRRFVIADSPGHIEYTRNMVTGASNADVAIILIDARKGVIEQTRRHYFITQLLGIRHIVITINKMDLVDFDETVYNTIKTNFEQLSAGNSLSKTNHFFLPISALSGENILSNSEKLNWYIGPSLLPLLETIQLAKNSSQSTALQVQNIIRPKTHQLHDYRGISGKVKSGHFHLGDQVQISPSGRSSIIQSIEKYGHPISELKEGENGTILLKDDLDINRGDSIFIPDNSLQEIKSLEATICWMQNDTIRNGQKYWLQQGSNRVLAKVQKVSSRFNTNLFENEASDSLGLNDIGEVELILNKPLLALPYIVNKALGAFILIDQNSNNTAGVGFIKEN